MKSTKGKAMKKKQQPISSAIVCAYHPAETDLEATTKSAMRSAGKGAKFYAVADKDDTGPGRNRHRGIEAATDAEVIVIIDAHMRFKGDVLARMIAQVKKTGGLLVPYCHNNETLSFDGQPYAGARMVWGSHDDDIKQRCALVAKWATDQTPGPRTAVMGACYVFRRDWYYAVGQPLSILDGWGCDEELLSIACWLSGHMPILFDGHVAHLYRARPPWPVAPSSFAKVTTNRRRMISAVCPDPTDRHDLFAWQGNQDAPITPEVERLRKALAEQPRKWAEWKRLACAPAEVNGKPVSGGVTAVAPPQEPKRAYHPQIVTPMYAIRCPHCGTEYDPLKLPVDKTYPNFRRHICQNQSCRRPFVSKITSTQVLYGGRNYNTTP
jgi:hypothetical protein